MARKFYELNKENRITVTADNAAPGAENPRSYDFPEDFDYYRQIDYKIEDGQLNYDPLPEEQEEEPGYDERIKALEEENTELREALDLILSGVTE